MELLARRVANGRASVIEPENAEPPPVESNRQALLRTVSNRSAVCSPPCCAPLQLSVKFIRWLRTQWLSHAPLNAAIACPQTLYAND
jgi:hypothetical protein